MEIKSLIQDLMNFIDESPTAFQAAKNIERKLKTEGFQSLDLTKEWEIKRGGKYFVTQNDSACIAFVVGSEDIEKEGFKLIGAHTDSPGFRIKPNPEMTTNGYFKLNTEVYGGPILNTWLDRPLSLAGRITLKTEDILKTKAEFIDFDEPLLIIPNLAIHMNRSVNEGVELNRQKDMLPIIGLIKESFEKDQWLLTEMSKRLNISQEEILDFDLFLYPFEKSCLIGKDQEFLSAPRLDNLAMTHAGITALCQGTPKTGVNVMVCYDNEEIGSRTKQGADSPFLLHVLERISLSLGKDREEFLRSLIQSFMISADMAHAIHPNAPEKHDPVNHPKINQGPVIKINANQSYTTDADSNGVYERLCQEAKVPVQKFVNRSDERGGSTIGPIVSGHLGIRSVDIGNPMLAMHSARELAGAVDHHYIIQSFKVFYNL